MWELRYSDWKKKSQHIIIKQTQFSRHVALRPPLLWCTPCSTCPWGLCPMASPTTYRHTCGLRDADEGSQVHMLHWFIILKFVKVSLYQIASILEKSLALGIHFACSPQRTWCSLLLPPSLLRAFMHTGFPALNPRYPYKFDWLLLAGRRKGWSTLELVGVIPKSAVEE